MDLSNIIVSNAIKLECNLLESSVVEVVEAAHQKLDKIWQFYIVKMVETEDHGRAFEKCVNHFNSMNVM